MRGLHQQFEGHMLPVGGSGEVMDVRSPYPAPMVDDALASIAAAQEDVAGDPVLVARLEREASRLRLTRLWLRFWEASRQLRRTGSSEAVRQVREQGRAYLDLYASLSERMPVGGTYDDFVRRTLEDIESPGATFREAGEFLCVDNLNDDGLVFEECQLLRTYLALPEGGHNRVEISTDGAETWTMVHEDVQMWGGSREWPLTEHVAGAERFQLKFVLENGPGEGLGMDQWGIAGVVP